MNKVPLILGNRRLVRTIQLHHFSEMSEAAWIPRSSVDFTTDPTSSMHALATCYVLRY